MNQIYEMISILMRPVPFRRMGYESKTAMKPASSKSSNAPKIRQRKSGSA